MQPVDRLRIGLIINTPLTASASLAPSRLSSRTATQLLCSVDHERRLILPRTDDAPSGGGTAPLSVSCRPFVCRAGADADTDAVHIPDTPSVASRGAATCYSEVTPLTAGGLDSNELRQSNVLLMVHLRRRDVGKDRARSPQRARIDERRTGVRIPLSQQPPCIWRSMKAHPRVRRDVGTVPCAAAG